MGGDEGDSTVQRDISKALDNITATFEAEAKLLDQIERTQVESEARVREHLTYISSMMRDVRNQVHKLIDHEKRLNAIEKRNGSRKR